MALVAAHQLYRRYRGSMAYLLPMAWVGCEWLRGRFPAGGFSWFILGQSQGAYEPATLAGRLVQVADLFGELGVSFVLAMTSGLVVDLITRPIMVPIGHGKHRVHPTLKRAGLVWFLILGFAWGYGEYRIHQWSSSTRTGPAVAVIQTNVPQNNKLRRTVEQDLKDFSRMVELTVQACEEEPRSDLVVWPETMVPAALNPTAIEFFTGVQSYYSGEETYHEAIRNLALQLHTHLLVGAPAYEGFVQETFADGSVGPVPLPRYNSVYLYYPDGEQAPVRYDKTHRVPFGEYIPWVGSVPAVKGLFIRWFTPYSRDYSLAAGESLSVFDIPVFASRDGGQSETPEVVRVVTPICYEDAVARDVRRLVYEDTGQKRADLIVNLTNSAWYPGDSQQPQHLQIASLRCVENRVPMARSVNGGISGFIDSLGRVRKTVDVDGRKQWVEGYAVDTLPLDSRRSLYGLLGDLPAGILALITAVMLFWGKLSSRRASSS